MKQLRTALLLALLATPVTAQQLNFPGTLGEVVLPPLSLIGNGSPGPATPNAVPFSQLGQFLTIPTQPAGTSNNTPASTQFVGQNDPLGVSVKASPYGAACDGVTDDTTAIQAALNSGAKQVYIPPANCAFSAVTIPDGVSMVGPSDLSACLKKNNATSDFITLGNGSQVRNVCIFAGVTQTAGHYFVSTASQPLIDNIFATGYFLFAEIGSVSVQSVQARITNIHTSSPATGAGSGLISLTNFSAPYLDNIEGSGTLSGNQPDFGIRFLNGDTAFVANSNITRHGPGLFMAPGNGQNTFGVYITNGVFDSAGTTSSGASPSCLIQPTGTGNVYETNIANVWCGLSIGADGMLVAAASGLVSDLHINGFHFSGNAGSGLHVGAGVQNLTLNGGTSGGNTLNGIFISGAATHVSITHCMCRPDPARSTPANGQFGINISSVALDYLTLWGNDVVGNTTGTLFNGATGTHNVIRDNPGYNPVGVAGVAYASTLTNGPTPATYYFTGGTCTNIALGAGNIASATSATTPVTVELGPNEAVTSTCSVNPTVIRSVH